ncbi:MAG: hypothetical protein U0Y82_09805 [Thermoleophilia bacterium]
MHPHRAHALRRAARGAAAIASALCAHAAATGGLRVLPVAPAVWAGLISLAALCGPRPGAFAARGPLRVLTGLAAAQAAVHILAVAAPWTLGLTGHAHTALVTPAAVLTHGTALVLLGAVLVRLERLLELAGRALEVLRGVSPRAHRPSPYVRLAHAVSVWCTAPRRGPRRTRGPPIRIVTG